MLNFGSVALITCAENYTLHADLIAAPPTCIFNDDPETNPPEAIWSRDNVWLDQNACVLNGCTESPVAGANVQSPGEWFYTLAGNAYVAPVAPDNLFFAGVVATLQCQPGYEASKHEDAAVSTSECFVDFSQSPAVGVWSPTATCKNSICADPALQVQQNHLVYTTETENLVALRTTGLLSFDSVVVECDVGYASAAASKLSYTCQPNIDDPDQLEWVTMVNAEVPVCEVAGCLPIESLLPGYIFVASYSQPQDNETRYPVGTVISFSCASPMVPAPAPTAVTCISDAAAPGGSRWSAQPSEMLSLSCANRCIIAELGGFANAELLDTSNTVLNRDVVEIYASEQNVYTVRCNTGYAFAADPTAGVWSSTVRCQSTGWEAVTGLAQVADCAPQLCPQLTTDPTLTANVTYPAVYLVEASYTCTENFYDTSIRAGAAVPFKCDVVDPVANIAAWIQQDAGPLPTCVPQCPLLAFSDALLLPSYSSASRTDGTTMALSCNAPFLIRNSIAELNIVCVITNDVAVWTPNPQQHVNVSTACLNLCALSGLPSAAGLEWDALALENDDKPGYFATDDGFMASCSDTTQALKGSTKGTFEMTSTVLCAGYPAAWAFTSASPTIEYPPSCATVVCSSLPDGFAPITALPDPAIMTTEVEFECGSAYELVNGTTAKSEKYTCDIVSGTPQWRRSDVSAPVLQCIASAPCGTFTVDNGTVALANGGTLADITCDIGFTNSGATTRSCDTVSGLWMESLPTCVLNAGCNGPVIIDPRFPTGAGYWVDNGDDTAMFTCAVEYEFSHNYALQSVSLSCSGPNWWDSIPTCVFSPVCASFPYSIVPLTLKATNGSDLVASAALQPLGATARADCSTVSGTVQAYPSIATIGTDGKLAQCTRDSVNPTVAAWAATALACLIAPEVISTTVTVDTSSVTIEIEFSAPTSCPVHTPGHDPTAAATLLCSAVLLNVASLGTDPLCSWPNETKFRILLGDNFEYTLSTSLTVRSGVVKLALSAAVALVPGSSASSFNANAMPAVANDVVAPKPAAPIAAAPVLVAMTSNSSVAACKTATISISSATTGGAGGALTYKYVLTSTTATGFAPALPSGFSAQTSVTLDFASVYIGEHVVMVTAHDWLGQESSQTLTIVSFADTISLQANILGDVYTRTLASSAPLPLTATLRALSNCGDSSAIAVTHSWATGTTLLSSQLSLIIPAYTFVAGSVSVLTYTATLSANPIVKAEFNVTITVNSLAPRVTMTALASERAPLVSVTSQTALASSVGAYTAANAVTLVTTSIASPQRLIATISPQPLAFSTTGTLDRNTNKDVVAYTWSCYRTAQSYSTNTWDATDCPNEITSVLAGGTPPEIPASAIALLARNDNTELRAVLVVALTVTSSGAAPLRARTVARFEILPALEFFTRPTVILPVETVATVLHMSPLVPLRFAANAAGPNRTYALLWACESGNINVSSSGTLASPLTGANLVVSAAALQPNQTYSFRVSIFVTAVTGPAFPNALPPSAAVTAAANPARAPGPLPGEFTSAVITVHTSALPFGGVCAQVDQSNDAVTGARAVVRCTGWAAEITELPLRYRFLRADTGLMLAATDVAPVAELTLLEGTTAINVEVISSLGVAVTVSVNVTIAPAAAPTLPALLAEAVNTVQNKDAWGFVQAAASATLLLNDSATVNASTSTAARMQIFALLTDPTVSALLLDAETADRDSVTNNSDVDDDSEDVLLRRSQSTLETGEASLGSAVAVQLLSTLVRSGVFINDNDNASGGHMSFIDATLALDLSSRHVQTMLLRERLVGTTTLSSLVALVDAAVQILYLKLSLNGKSSNHLVPELPFMRALSNNNTGSSESVASILSARTDVVVAAALQDAVAGEDPATMISGDLAYVALRLLAQGDSDVEITLPQDETDSEGSGSESLVNIAGISSDSHSVTISSLTSSVARAHTVLQRLRSNQPAHIFATKANTAMKSKGVRVPGALVKTIGGSSGGKLDAGISALLRASLLSSDSLENNDTRLPDTEAGEPAAAPLKGMFAGSVGLTLFDASGAEIKISNTGVSIVVSNGTAPAPISASEADRVFIVTIPHEQTLPVNYTATCQFLDEVTNMWSQRGCAVAEATSEYTICKCNHLTMFSVRLSPKYFAPRVLSLNVKSFTSISWNQISRNPAPLISLCVWLVLFLLLVWFGARIDRKYDKKGMYKLLSEWHPSSQILLTKAEEYGVAANASSFAFLKRRFWRVFRRDHTWLCLWLRPTTDDFGSQSRGATSALTVLIALAIAATFFGSQEREAAMTISLITTAITFPIGKFFQLVFEFSDSDRLKRFIYYYAEHLAFLHIYGYSSDNFFTPEQTARLLAMPQVDIQMVRDLVPELGRWRESDDEAAERYSFAMRSKSINTKSTEINDTADQTHMSRQPEPMMRVPNTYSTHRQLERDNKMLRVLLRSTLTLDAADVVNHHRHRPFYTRLPRGLRMFGIVSVMLIGLACVMLVMVMGMEMDRSVGSTAVRDWLLSTAGSVVTDAFLSGPIMAFIRSTIIYYAKYMLLGRCFTQPWKRYDCMSKLASSRRLSITAINVSYLEVMGVKAEPRLQFDTPEGLTCNSDDERAATVAKDTKKSSYECSMSGNCFKLARDNSHMELLHTDLHLQPRVHSLVASTITTQLPNDCARLASSGSVFSVTASGKFNESNSFSTGADFDFAADVTDATLASTIALSVTCAPDQSFANIPDELTLPDQISPANVVIASAMTAISQDNEQNDPESCSRHHIAYGVDVTAVSHSDDSDDDEDNHMADSAAQIRYYDNDALWDGDDDYGRSSGDEISVSHLRVHFR